MLLVADSLEAAKSKAKKTAFYKHTSLAATANARNAESHIDDKFGIDVDDMFAVRDILSPQVKEKYNIRVSPSLSCKDDDIHLGYTKLKDLKI